VFVAMGKKAVLVIALVLLADAVSDGVTLAEMVFVSSITAGCWLVDSSLAGSVFVGAD
jgi:hypothetical protein